MKHVTLIIVFCISLTLVADERPLVADENSVTITDLHATIMNAMGVSPKIEFSIESRPFYVTEDGKGKAVADIFA